MIEQAHCVGCGLADSFARCVRGKESFSPYRPSADISICMTKDYERYLWSQRGKEVGFNRGKDVGFNLSNMQYQDGKASMLGP